MNNKWSQCTTGSSEPVVPYALLDDIGPSSHILLLTNILCLLAIPSTYQFTSLLFYHYYPNIDHYSGLLTTPSNIYWKHPRKYVPVWPSQPFTEDLHLKIYQRIYGGFGFFWGFQQHRFPYNHLTNQPHYHFFLSQCAILWWAHSPLINNQLHNISTCNQGSLIKIRQRPWHRDPCNWYCTYWIHWKRWIGADHLHARLLGNIRHLCHWPH